MDSQVHRHYSSRVIRRFVLFLLPLMLIAPRYLHSDSVTILFDASYSLSLHSDGRTRIDRLRDELDRWMSEQPLSTRYALLVAEHQAVVRQLLPYPATSRQVSLALREVAPWGSVDLFRVTEQAARTASSIALANDEAHATLLLLTDGEDIGALMPPRPVRLPENVELKAIVLPSTSPASVLPLLDALTEQHTLTGPDPEAVPMPEPSIIRTEQPPQRSEHAALVRWARVARWVFATTFLLGLTAVARAAGIHRRRVAIAERHNNRPPILQLEIRRSSGRETVRVEDYPRALDVDGGAAPLEFTEREGAIVVSSRDAIRINGMRRIDHLIDSGDQIRCGTTRVAVRDIARTKPVRVPRSRHGRYGVVPAAAAAVAILSFIVAPPSESTVTASATAVPAPSAESRRSEPETTQVRRPPVSTVTPSGPTPTLPTLTLPATVRPADPLPQARVDYLAIHAHPDDEALYFGALLARLHARGLTGAVVILTDGESGLDQHPWRDIDDTYPDHRLAGIDLANVRIAEARESIGWLGGSFYLRLGLPNHPYNTWLDELSPLEVIERWGGEDHLVSRIEKIIRHFQPRVIIGPDGPGPALEHFEHQATGILVARAVDRVYASPDNPVEAHIVAIDPRQPSGYDDLISISPWTIAQDGTVPRLRQFLALRAHRTQRDATVIGLETRLSLPYDYVLVRRGDRDTVRRLFGSAVANGSADAAPPDLAVPHEDLTGHR